MVSESEPSGEAFHLLRARARYRDSGSLDASTPLPSPASGSGNQRLSSSSGLADTLGRGLLPYRLVPDTAAFVQYVRISLFPFPLSSPTPPSVLRLSAMDSVLGPVSELRISSPSSVDPPKSALQASVSLLRVPGRCVSSDLGPWPMPGPGPRSRFGPFLTVRAQLDSL
ncbi:hypothetical protein DFH06DRAFT_1344879 [Mycena polygramma]|nr:hypothetical protein DFH06DRAFT_1344879 [Mycena polygramma]